MSESITLALLVSPFVVYLPVYLLGTAIHELGHASVAVLCGYRLHQVWIGSPGAKRYCEIPFMLNGNRSYLCISANISGGAMDAYREETTVTREVAIALAGVAANIVAVLLVYIFRGWSDFHLAAQMLANPTTFSWAEFFPTAFFVCFIYRNALGVFNLVPIRMHDGSSTDGARVIDALL